MVLKMLHQCFLTIRSHRLLRKQHASPYIHSKSTLTILHMDTKNHRADREPLIWSQLSQNFVFYSWHWNDDDVFKPVNNEKHLKKANRHFQLQRLFNDKGFGVRCCFQPKHSKYFFPFQIWRYFVLFFFQNRQMLIKSKGLDFIHPLMLKICHTN